VIEEFWFESWWEAGIFSSSVQHPDCLWGLGDRDFFLGDKLAMAF
jgi:hypothetical protein